MRYILACLTLLSVLLAGCERQQPGAASPSPVGPPASATTAGTAAASGTVTPVASPTTLPFPQGAVQATVTRVIDGDTIEVELGGQSYKVRYIGIDTPETVDPERPVQCFGREASERNRQLVAGRTVGLEKDVSETDRYGRLLRYVWVDGRMVNAVLVEEGYAMASTFPPDVKYAALFASLQAQAREAGRGLWGAACSSPTPAQAAAGVCDYSGTSQPVIKGNISSSGEKIYHVPGGDYYDKTVIDEASGERWFCTEAEAMAAGWRRSER